MRPGYKSIALPKKYVPLNERVESFKGNETYVPTLERIVTKGDDGVEN